MGKLTTHVLDTARGKPANGIVIAVQRIQNNETVQIKTVETNSDGRVDEAVLSGNDFSAGQYQLVFKTGPYLDRFDSGDNPRFLDDIVIRFGVSDPTGHYHVPLLLSGHGYSTYRGS